MGMPVDKGRQKKLTDLMRRQEDDAKSRGGLPRAKFIVKGKAEQCPIYSFRTSDLLLNRSNGRIKSQIMDREAELGCTLDVAEEETQRIIKDILQSIRKEENAKIKADLERNGQMQPGIVTCDGIVINGNRRKVLLEELFDEKNAEEYAYLDAHVLPSDIEKREVWLIEAGIQLSTPQQLDYSPVNHLLKLREGKDSGLDIDSMARRIYGVDPEKLREDLERLKLIDEYLEDFLDKKGRYHLVEGKNEHFISLQKYVLDRVRSPRARSDWSPTESDIAELKVVAFNFIRSRGFPHMRIRDLREMFLTETSWRQLQETQRIEVSVGEEETPAPPAEEPTPADEAEEAEEDASGDEAPAASRAAQLDKAEEAHWVKKNRDTLKRFFEESKEQLQIEKDRAQPLALAERALKNIRAIQEDSVGVEAPALDEVLRRIIEKANALRAFHHKQRKSQKHRKKTKPSKEGAKGKSKSVGRPQRKRTKRKR